MATLSTKSWLKRILTVLALGLFSSSTAYAEEASEADVPAGIVPVHPYTGDFWERTHLLGDWGGKRTEWANKGFQFDMDWVHWTDSVVNGGKSDGTESGGTITYNIHIDLMRAGILPGAMIQIRGESYDGGPSASVNTGQITPSNMASLSPTNYKEIGQGFDLSLSHFTYLQLFNEHFGVIAGKFDLYADGDSNEFAGGRGRTQFANWSLNVGTPLLFVPASTVGAGVVIMPNHNLTITSLVLSGTQCTNNTCLEDLSDKGGLSANLVAYQYTLGGLPGGVSGNFMYFFDNDFTELGGLVPELGDGILGGSTKNDTWIVGGSFWQYMSVKEPVDGPLNLTNRKQDLRGWGIWGRMTFADDDVNPWKNSFALGVGGRGVFDSRPEDAFGVGYFFNEYEETLFQTEQNYESHGSGWEVYYNFAVTRAINFSTNAQYIRSVESDIDNSVQLTGRLQVIF